MSSNKSMWTGLAAGAALGAGFMFGVDVSSLVDPTSLLGGVDASSLANGFGNFDGGFDGVDDGSTDYGDSGASDGYQGSDAQSGSSGFTQHFGSAFHHLQGLAAGAAAQQAATNAYGRPLMNRNGLPVLKNINLGGPGTHSCSNCGDDIYSTRIKCKSCARTDATS
ncbi:hypothetical protein EXIGLDRAFT_699189 [Exidia glandulosa HHB12029]|uniref:Uncharacterized protein n=1 Tax=Exidia glandulosa HHB12029 TaxID=1314781 RepID=A0A165Q9W9_EXIGL|nr:hypothetical protein EXIGLDRAFT_699189 [Exidia glandulosa HHB12029]